MVRLSIVVLMTVLITIMAGTASSRMLGQHTDVAGSCVCTREYNPVCNTLNGTTYSNPCTAKCAGVPSVILIPGACPAKTASCVAKCPLNSGIQNYDPVCVINGSSNTTRVYFNPCIAQCFATSAVVGSYKGLCSAAADRKCAATVVKGAVVCETRNAVERPNRCYAEALTKRNVTNALYSGQCKQAQAVSMVNARPPRNPIQPEPVVNCFADPCMVSPPCSTNPKAKCVSKYFASYFRSLFLGGVCQAVWVGTAGNIDLNCTFPASLSPVPEQ